jgi:Fe-S cluster assembly protein SufD
MTQTAAIDERYNADFAALLDQRRNEPSWLRELRQRGIDAFNELGFPTARHGNEAWKYTDIRPIAEAAFKHSDGPGRVDARSLNDLISFDADMDRIVFVDGHFAAELSRLANDGALMIAPLSESVERDEALVKAHLGRYLDPHHGAFTALNTALWRGGAFVHVRKPAATPVHIVYLTTEHSTAVVTYPRTLIVADESSEASVIETFVSLGQLRHFTDPACEIALAPNSTIRHHRLLLENHASFHVAHMRTHQDADSTFESLSYAAGGGLVRIDLEALLDAPGANADLHGLYITSGAQHIDNNIEIDHAQPHGTSRLYYKGILDDQSKAVFGGIVFVRKGADKTDAHQQDKNLLLSPEAEVDSKPSLEIYADDVKAGHGATAGALADEAMFYMQSRGLDPDTAMQFLVRGFAGEILDTVEISPLREWLEQHTMQALPRFRSREVAA